MPERRRQRSRSAGRVIPANRTSATGPVNGLSAELADAIVELPTTHLHGPSSTTSTAITTKPTAISNAATLERRQAAEAPMVRNLEAAITIATAIDEGAPETVKRGP